MIQNRSFSLVLWMYSSLAHELTWLVVKFVLSFHRVESFVLLLSSSTFLSSSFFSLLSSSFFASLCLFSFFSVKALFQAVPLSRLDLGRMRKLPSNTCITAKPWRCVLRRSPKNTVSGKRSNVTGRERMDMSMLSNPCCSTYHQSSRSLCSWSSGHSQLLVYCMSIGSKRVTVGHCLSKNYGQSLSFVPHHDAVMRF